tara:strand:- start:393 stop:647 length:255 start_codon:yes stop_codon:yes gene_type:complete
MSKMPTTYAAYKAIGTIGGGAEYEAEFTFSPSTQIGTWYYDVDGCVFQDGTLEFEGNMVIDYDGAFDLPIPVKELIESKGFYIA